jgi:curved DNA-binding protein CbpA
VDVEKDIREQLAKAKVANHFELLNVSREATTEQVKDAFLPLAKKYHPDRLSSQGQTHLLEPARELFARIKEAYDVLLDPVSRAKYLTEIDGKRGGKKLSTEDARTGYRRALDYQKRRKFAEAEAELIRAIDVDPQPDYLAELAWTLLANPARRDEASDQIFSLSARSLKDPMAASDRVYIVAAHVARLKGDTEKMERYFRDALEKNPKNVEASRELRLIETRKAEKPKGGGLFDRFRKK